jgi:hypothetical protein
MEWCERALLAVEVRGSARAATRHTTCRLVKDYDEG